MAGEVVGVAWGWGLGRGGCHSAGWQLLCVLTLHASLLACLPSCLPEHVAQACVACLCSPKLWLCDALQVHHPQVSKTCAAAGMPACQLASAWHTLQLAPARLLSGSKQPIGRSWLLAC